MIETKAQGCSDAGFCTMGAMKPDQHYSEKLDVKLRSVEINGYRGSTTLTPIIYVLSTDLTFSIFNNVFLQVKVPYQFVSGSLGDTQGMGDISISATSVIMSNEKGTLSGTLGGKIPTNSSNLEKQTNEFGSEGQDLPMYYQVSLGTYDIVAGASWINNKWLFATGIQIPLNRNKNNFRWGHWSSYPNAENPDDTYIKKYDLANDLKRGTDIMFRVERNFRFTNFNFGVGLLPIIRITKDERYDFNLDKRIKIDGTTGLALSALFNAGYNFNVNNGVKFIYGVKLMQRDVNPDGLTRHDVLSLSYVYRF
ncbi:MAG: hypothetical protein OCD76_06335 [Reichenbachiella sp.]